MDDERREYEELRRKNRNYTLSFKHHKMYQRHVRIWKSLIDSNDPRIYSDWSTYTHVKMWGDTDDASIIMALFDNPLLDSTGIPFAVGPRNRRSLVLSRFDLMNRENRHRLIQHLWDSYVYAIEQHSEYSVLYDKFADYSVTKEDLVKTVDRIMDDYGNNPFDIVFYVTTLPYQKRANRSMYIGLGSFVLLLVAIEIGLLFDGLFGLSFFFLPLLGFAIWLFVKYHKSTVVLFK